MKEILFENSDLDYKSFHAKLIPDIDENKIIGVRVPHIRRIAKQFEGTDKRNAFMKELPHTYYEENNLHAFFIAQIKDFSECITELEKFLPYIDNWATCDELRPVCFAKNKNKLICHIYKWISSENAFTVRFGIEMLMVHFLDEDFEKKHLETVASVKNEQYYVKMMVAWYFATALAKKWEQTVSFITDKKLDIWVHNKAIQKALESYRITEEQKNFLRGLKITKNNSRNRG